MAIIKLTVAEAQASLDLDDDPGVARFADELRRALAAEIKTATTTQGRRGRITIEIIGGPSRLAVSSRKR